MTKLLCSLVLFAGMTGLVSSGSLGLALAQDKKDTKKDTKDTKKDAPKTTAKAGVIEVNEGKDEKFRFVIRDADGKLLAMSGPTGFATREDAIKALETLKEALPTAKIAAPKKEEKKDK